LLEGVGDKYAYDRFYIPDEKIEFDEKYNISKIERDKLIRINERASIVKNPISLENFADNVRGLIDKHGNVYLSVRANCIHQTIIDSLVEQGFIKDVPNWMSRFPTEFITIQRQGQHILMGESNFLLKVPTAFFNKEIKDSYMPIINKAKEINPTLSILFKLHTWNV